MPDTRLILHVKGTEAETKEVPKEEVRAGLSQGKFSQTQLIWSPSQNAWKQAKEWPELSTEEQLILHVKGTEAETRQLPKPQVRAAISQGEITHSQLIWSPTESAWKQVRELPELLPSQKLAPAPAPIPVKAPEPIIPESPAGPVARAAVAAGNKPQIRAPVALTGTPVASTPTAVATPKVHVATAATGAPQVKVAAAAATPQVKVAAASAPSAGAPKVRVKAATAAPKMAAAGSPSVRANAMVGHSGGSHTVHEEDEHHPMKWLCIGMGTLVFLILGLNFLLVNLPLRTKFVRTAYNNVTVYAHFAAFVQPNVVVIHIMPSPQVTGENLPELLVALARSTPNSAITGGPFERVALTSSWTAQYSFSKESWKQVADLDQDKDRDKDTAADRKKILLEHLDDANGQPVVEQSTLSEDAQQARRDAAWNKFVADFSTK